MNPPVLVLDNGALTIKAGFSHLHPTPRLLPNRVARLQAQSRRLYVADELYQCTAWEKLHWRVPFERGILTNWDIEKVVWDRIFSRDVLNVDPKQSSILVTEPPFNLPNVGATYDQIIFEEYEFASYHRCSSASLVPYGTLYGDRMPEVAVVVESGHSFTHVLPIYQGQVFAPGVRRIDIGGHLLTNHLKLMLSFRQFDMTDLTWIVDDIKHKLCFASRQFRQDIETCHATLPPGPDGRIPPNPFELSYVLPDFTSESLGHALPFGRSRSPTKPDHATVHLSNERFGVPELIFRPDNIGLKQAGLSRCIADAIATLPEEGRDMAWANIGLIGGNVLFEGFAGRLEDELRPLAPTEVAIKVHRAEDPITSTYCSAVRFASSPEYFEKAVTKQDYEEIGSAGLRRLFAGEKRSLKTRASTETGIEEEQEDEEMEDAAENEEIVEIKISKGRTAGRGKPAEPARAATGRTRPRRSSAGADVAVVEAARVKGGVKGKPRKA